MNIFEHHSFDNHEQIVFCQDKCSGLKAIIAIHNTRLGPAIGGCRVYPYTSVDDALTDVLRLSKGMTYKAAISNLNFGGAKSVIIGDPKEIASEALFRTFGRFVNSLNGRYMTAEDVGTDEKCMEWVRIETGYVLGIPSYVGGLGDPSPATAYGVMLGIKASLKKLTGKESVANVKIAVQGLGHVGYYLCKHLHEQGAKIYVCDPNKQCLKQVASEFKVNVVEPNEIFGLGVDVFAPCALGAVINDKTIPRLKCGIVAGSANNQLEYEKEHSVELRKRNILYAPDYVINAGGLISAATEFFGLGDKIVWVKTEEIYDKLLKVFNFADKENISTVIAANKVAEKRIHDIKQCHNIYNKRWKNKR